MSRPLRMGAAAAVVAASVLLSRLLGLGREALLAGLIGVNSEGDLYRQAFTLPDFLNYLLAGAYLTITLIPILSRHLERGDSDGASRAFTSVFRFIGVAIVALTLLMWVFADQLVSLVFPEVIENHDRLVSMTRLVLPAQVFRTADGRAIHPPQIRLPGSRPSHLQRGDHRRWLDRSGGWRSVA